MAEVKDVVELVQMAVKLPRPLMKAVKIRCVETDVHVQEFVAAALRDRLAARPA